MTDMIEVENVNTPGRVSRVNAAKYAEMRTAFEKALPRKPPGLTQNETRDAVEPHLDLEAKGLLVREPTKPLRWHWK